MLAFLGNLGAGEILTIALLMGLPVTLVILAILLSSKNNNRHH